jgi:hypothetical protein
VGVSALGNRLPLVMPWVLALSVVLVASTRRRPRELEAALITVEVLLVTAGVLVTGGASSALLVYLPAATLIAGGTYGPRAVCVTAGSEAGLLLVGRLLDLRSTGATDAFTSASLEFVILALVVGLLAARRASPSEPRQYAQVNKLLEQLHSATRDLPGGLDPGSVADALLDRLDEQVHPLRSAVLVRVGSTQLAPLSYRGMLRLPWRDPGVEPGPLRTCLQSEQPVLDVRPPDDPGRRAGGALLVLPLRASGRLLGLAALETRDARTMSSASVAELARMADAVALPLDTALLFDQLRSCTSMEERERLAQEMHDGVAQDLAFLGYEIDSLRRKLPQDAAAHAQAVQLRSTVNDLVAELRVSIADLRTSMQGERGLGAVLTSYVRRVASRAGLTVHLSLSESTFRLSGDVEVQLFRIAQDVIAGIRRNPLARNLWLDLSIDPPTARLVLEHDGPPDDSSQLDLEALAERARAFGADVSEGAGYGRCRIEIALPGGAR